MTAVASAGAARARRYALVGSMFGPLAAVASVVAPYVFALMRPHGAALVALALTPAALLVVSMVFLGRWLRLEPDEFVRNTAAEAMLWATGALMAVASALGYLALYRLISLSPLLLALSYPMWLCAYAAAGPLIRLRYR